MKKELVEQRRHARFQVPILSAYVLLTRGGPCSPIVGNIVDIGMGGVSFRYIAREEPPHKLSYLDILLPDGSFHLDRMPVGTVSSDFEVENERSAHFFTRRCRVKFGALTDHQKSGLTHFIRTHTTADPEG